MPEPPERDLYELALRLRPSSGEPAPRVVNLSPVSLREGLHETFWVSDPIEVRAYTVEAALVLVSENAYWYVDDELELSVDGLNRAAEAFEREIRPIMTRSFGDIWSPGVDNDPRLTILHTSLRGVAGYYGSQDEYPRQTHPQSNQREMIYMDGGRLKPGSREYLGVLTHELQHAVQWNLDSGEDSWVNEGMSEVAKELAGYRADFVDLFLRDPDTQLNYWPDDIRDSPAHYGAATLFLSYMAQHYGGFDSLKDLVREPLDGINGVEAHLSAYGATFLDVFADWVVANYLDAPDGPYGYADRSVAVRDVETMADYGEWKDTLPQFAARYIDLRLEHGDALVSFQGDSQVKEFGTSCRSGLSCWWSNRGDSIDSTLTREFDLSDLSSATFEFWTWFEIEEDWDHAYVEVSTDGGLTWTIMEGRHTTLDNPVGNSFGHGFTGGSGGWVSEAMDLTPFVGGRVALRFEYITDDAVYLDGFVIDDVAIQELGFFDDAEGDRGWQAAGFVRTANKLPQDYLVQVIEESVDGKRFVRRVSLDDEKNGRTLLEGFGTSLEHAVVVVSPVTRGTHQAAHYTLKIERAGNQNESGPMDIP